MLSCKTLCRWFLFVIYLYVLKVGYLIYALLICGVTCALQFYRAVHKVHHCRDAINLIENFLQLSAAVGTAQALYLDFALVSFRSFGGFDYAHLFKARAALFYLIHGGVVGTLETHFLRYEVDCGIFNAVYARNQLLQFGGAGGTVYIFKLNFTLYERTRITFFRGRALR